VHGAPISTGGGGWLALPPRGAVSLGRVVLLERRDMLALIEARQAVRRPLRPFWRPFWLRFTYVASVPVKKY
jgi:hypothetical protein